MALEEILSSNPNCLYMALDKSMKYRVRGQSAQPRFDSILKAKSQPFTRVMSLQGKRAKLLVQLMTFFLPEMHKLKCLPH